MKKLFESWRYYLVEQEDKTATLETKEGMMAWVSAHFPQYGNPLRDRDGLEKLSTDMGYETFKDFLKERAPRRLLISALETMYNNYSLPEQKEGTVRINHTTGLRVDGSQQRYSDIDNILTYGIVNQAEGSGRHSESPMSIFGLRDNPGSGEDNVYNPNFPWITLELPEDDSRYQFDLRGGSPGSVVVLSREVPEQYIIGVSGVSKYDYLRAVRKYVKS